MPVRITGRHVDVTDAIRKYINKKLPRIEKYTDRIQTIDIVLEKDGFQYESELRLKSGPIEINASVKDPDLMRSIDMLMDTVEGQMAKKWSKLRTNKKHGTETPRKLEAAAEAAEEAEEATEKKGKRKARTAPVVRTMPTFVDSVGVYIFPKPGLSAKPLSVEDAAEELYFSDENFLCFLNGKSKKLNIMYRRKDGNFSVFQPLDK